MAGLLLGLAGGYVCAGMEPALADGGGAGAPSRVQPSQRILGGSPVPLETMTGVVMVRHPTLGNCTGTVIAQDPDAAYILSAYHCVAAEITLDEGKECTDGNEEALKQLYIQYSHPGTKPPSQVQVASICRQPSDKSTGAYGLDVVVLKTAGNPNYDPSATVLGPSDIRITARDSRGPAAGAIYGYSTVIDGLNGSWHYASGPLTIAYPVYQASMGDAVDSMEGGARSLSLTPVQQGGLIPSPIPGDSGGPFIFESTLQAVGNQVAVAVDSSTAWQFGWTAYSTVDPDWLRKITKQIVITSPGPDAYYGWSNSLSAAGQAEPGRSVRVWALGSPDNQACVANVDAGGNWFCTVAVPTPWSPARLIAQYTDAPGAMIGDVGISPYTGIDLKDGRDNGLMVWYPSMSSGNYGGPDKRIVLPRYPIAGWTIPGAIVDVALQEGDLKQAKIICPRLPTDKKGRWTCEMDTPDGGRYMTAIAANTNPSPGSTAPHYYATQTWFTGQPNPNIPFIKIESPQQESGELAKVTGPGFPDADSAIELTSSAASGYSNGTWGNGKYSADLMLLPGGVRRLSARQFVNGIEQSADVAYVTVPPVVLQVESPSDFEQTGFRYMTPDSGKAAAIGINGIGTVRYRVRVVQVDPGDPATEIKDGYACTVDVGQDGKWTCSDVDWTVGDYALKFAEESIDTSKVRQTAIVKVSVVDPPVIDWPEDLAEIDNLIELEGHATPWASMSILLDPGSARDLDTSGTSCSSSRIKADAQGRWRCSMLVPEEEGDVHVTAKEYIDEKFIAQTSATYHVKDDDDDDDDNPDDHDDDFTIADPPADGSDIPPGASITGLGWKLFNQFGAVIQLTWMDHSYGDPIPDVDLHVNSNNGRWETPGADRPGGKLKFSLQAKRNGSLVGTPKYREFYYLPRSGDGSGRRAVTLNQQIPIEGAAQPGAVIEVTLNDKPLCKVDRVPDSGQWQCGNYPSAQVGTYWIDVRQTMPGWKDLATREQLVVGTPPAVVTSPAEGAVGHGTPYTIRGTGEPGAAIAVTGDMGSVPGGFSDTTFVDKDGNWTTRAYVPMPGSYTVSVVQSVSGRSQSTPTTRSFSVQIMTPFIQSPAENEVVNQKTYQVQGGAEPYMQVQLVQDHAPPRLVDADKDGVWSTTIYADTYAGPHVLRATSVINGVPVGQTFTRTFQVSSAAVDTIAPISIESPGRDDTISTSVYRVAGSADKDARVRLTGENLPARDVPVDSAGGWFADYVAIPGSYTVTATEYFPGGQEVGSDSRSYSVSGSAAPLKIVTPVDNGEVDVHYQIAGSGEPDAIVVLDDPTGATPCRTSVSKTGDWSCGPFDVSPGPHTVRGTQWLLSGDTFEQIGDGVSRAYVVKQQFPPVVILTPTEGQIVTDAIYNVSGTAAPGARINLNGVGLEEQDAIPVGADGKWTATYPAKTGDYTVQSRQYVGGEQKGDPALRHYRVQGDLASLVIAQPREGEVVDVTPYVVSGMGQAGAQVDVTGLGDPPCQTSIADDGKWSCGPYASGPGQYRIQAQQQVQTAMGLLPAGDPVIRRYSVIGPPLSADVSITTPLQGQTVERPYPVAGRGEPGAIVTVSGQGLPTRDGIVVQEDGSWSTTYDDDTPVGDFDITAAQSVDNKPLGPNAQREYRVVGAPWPFSLDSPNDDAVIPYKTYRPFPVSGRGTPGHKVTVQQTQASGGPAQAVVGVDGAWQTEAVFLPPPSPACGLSACMSDYGTITATQDDGSTKTVKFRGLRYFAGG